MSVVVTVDVVTEDSIPATVLPLDDALLAELGFDNAQPEAEREVRALAAALIQRMRPLANPRGGPGAALAIPHFKGALQHALIALQGANLPVRSTPPR